MNEVLKKLSAPFSSDEVRQRSDGRGGKLDYVGWDSVVRRLNDVVGLDWSLQIKQASVVLTDQTTKGGKPLYMAQVMVELALMRGTGPLVGNGPDATRRGGVGAALMADPDDALKTAQAEALKKASNQYGMALELWTEEGREIVAKGRAASSGDIGAMKALVFEKALMEGAEPTAESVAKTLGITLEELQDAETLAAILAGA